MINGFIDKSAKKEQNLEEFSIEDLRVLVTIKEITNKGDNAEVKKSKNGGLKVYEVKKQIAFE